MVWWGWEEVYNGVQKIHSDYGSVEIRRKKHWEMMKEMVHHQVLCMCNMMRDPKESNKSVAPVAKRGRKAAGQGGGGMRSRGRKKAHEEEALQGKTFLATTTFGREKALFRRKNNFATKYFRRHNGR
ncbi:unnamed protein product [Prunus armeniaca]|uniref:Uncharacterized protein n=1 Tax=Prunus armeniaca TaxID=36596 RepID=A0A6J5UW34_PRUAR|nr:unnamed protein product [Prunus armeniaca]